MRSRILRIAGGAGMVVGCTVTFGIGAVTAVLAHLDLPATRRVVAKEVGPLLKDVLEGSIEVHRIGHLGLDGIRGVHATVRDPEGVQVLHVDDVRVSVRGIAAARSALFGKGPIVIEIPAASVAHVDVAVDADARGDLRISNAFVTKGPPEPKKQNEPEGRGVRVEAPDVRLRHIWAHGAMPGTPLVDADVSDVVAHAHVDPAVVRAKLQGAALAARGLPKGLAPNATLAGRIAIPAHNGQGVDLEATVDGEANGIRTTAELHLEDQRLDAYVDVRGSARDANAMLDTELREALDVHAEAHGDLPVIDADATVAFGRARVAAKATIEAAKTTRIKGTVTARHVDAAAVAEGAPSSDVGLDASGNVAMKGEEYSGEVAIDTLPGRLAGKDLPPTQVRATAKNKDSAELTARVLSAAMPTQIDVIKEGPNVDARVRSHIPDLKRVPLLPPIDGSANIEAKAKLTLPVKGLAAEAAIDLDGLALPAANTKAPPSIAARKVRVTARAHGSFDKPVIDATVLSTDVVAANLPFKTIDARARVEAGKVVTVRDARVDLVRQLDTPRAVTATVKRVEIAGAGVRIDELEVNGIGEPLRANVTMRSARDIQAAIDAPKIDAALVARLAGAGDSVTRGVIGIHGEGSFQRGDAKGKIHIEAHDVATSAVATDKGFDGEIDATVDGASVGADVNMRLADAGQVTFRTENVRLGSAQVTDPKAWEHVHGRAHLTSQIDLGKIANLCRPPCQLPVAELRGVLTVQGRLGRDDEGAAPEIQLHAHTNGLVVAGRTAPAQRMVRGIVVEPPPSWRSSDVDFGVDIRNDGPSGFTSASLRANDGQGIVAAFDAKTELPWADIAKAPAKALDYVYVAPISAKFIVPTRRFERLPMIAAQKDMSGTIEAELDASGTVLEPNVHFSARTRKVRSPVMPRDFETDADVGLDYDGRSAKLAAKVRSKNEELLDVATNVDVKIADVIAGNPQWNAGGKVRLASFPLESIPQLAERAVKGRVSGEVSLDGLHRDAHVGGHLDFQNLSVGKAEYKSGRVTLDAGNGAGSVAVRLDQTDGYLDAKASTGLTWGADVAPSLDNGKPIEATLDAKSFRAAAISPFLGEAIPLLDGRIDANARVRLVPGGKPELGGEVAFRDGTVAVATLGAELRKVRAKATFSPDGTIRVTDVSAHGTTGEVTAAANVKLDGTRVADATANVRIQENRALDFAIAGQPIGNVWGAINVRASQSADAKNTKVLVDIPKFSIELPKVIKSGVQGLEQREDIHVGVYRDPSRFVAVPLDRADIQPVKTDEKKVDDSRLDVDVRLGAITVSRGNQANIVLAGNPKVKIAGGETSLTGEIHAKSGWADVQGKKFVIEKASVTLNGENPPNPVVVATAGWTAYDGTKVFADFVGPVKTGKVNLRSEPPRPKGEILSMVLFGTADGANPTPPPGGSNKDGTAKAAAGIGGGFVASGLTEALDDLSGVQATARIDTTHSNNPRPELELQISQKVSLGFAYVLGTPPITEPDKSFANVDYRFHRNWSLETTFGDRGTALMDAIWQKRY